MGALVVAAGDGLEALLTSGVPNLQLDGLAVDLDGTDLEVDSDGGHKVVSEDVIGESEQERGLADAGVSNEEHLEEVIAKGRWGQHVADTYYSGFILARVDYYFKIIKSLRVTALINTLTRFSPVLTRRAVSK